MTHFAAGQMTHQSAWVDELAQAKMETSLQKAKFNALMADQKSQFDSQMAAAMIDASHMKVRPRVHACRPLIRMMRPSDMFTLCAMGGACSSAFVVLSLSTAGGH